MYKNRQLYPISQSATILKVTRAGYYDWLKRKPSSLKLRHEYLTKEVKRVFNQHNGNYGSPRIAQQLYDEGIETNKRVVAMLMQRASLVAKGYRTRTVNYNRRKRLEAHITDNLLNRQFDQLDIDHTWVTDITYIQCCDGRLYLSTYIDLATRIPRTYQVATSMKHNIVLNPISTYKGKLPNIIHSDRGSQYTSYAFSQLLEAHSISHSMSAPGNPVDNAVIESFHRSIKRELILPNKHKSRAEMQLLIVNYLSLYYVHERIHTKFMMTLSNYEHSLRHNKSTHTPC